MRTGNHCVGGYALSVGRNRQEVPARISKLRGIGVFGWIAAAFRTVVSSLR